MAVRARVHARARERAAAPARARQRLGEAPRARVVEIQRSRLLAAAASVVDERGFSHTTVAHITEHARVSRRTFYDLFEDREDCLLAVFEDAVDLIRREVLAATGAAGRDWRERVRAGLWAILSFLDREPVLARVCVVQTLRSGTRPLERREEVLTELARVLDEGRGESARGGACPPLTSEGLIGAVSTILYGRLCRGEHPPLTTIFGELMEIIVLPYLGPSAARKEHARAAPAPVPVAGVSDAEAGILVGDGHGGRDPLAELPMRLTYRTARVMEAVADSPGVSNRAIGEHAGMTDQGQISRLLSRLRRLGLVVNGGEGHARGEANAWMLTETGRRVVRSIGAHAEGLTADGSEQ
jgi:AcrR family transcriptional regulator/DNA-binding MarR family transcriptional regulator